MSKEKHLFPYNWELKNGYPAKGIEPNNYKVFGTFVCGGGSTMGYKLAGFEHLGGVEIDKKITEVYKANHKPKYFFSEDIREFNKREDLPKELFNLDILDGSPPCSSFSMAGAREKNWGKKKKFAEGQTKQVLDDLVFEYCDTILKLKPKVFLLENVKGIILGNAKAYSKKIVQKLTADGYKVQVFLLNAASMGVPQKRERVFFIGHKKKYNLPKLVLNFNEKPILFKEYTKTIGTEKKLTPTQLEYYNKCKQGKNFSSVHTKGFFFNSFKLENNSILPTIAASGGIGGIYHPTEARKINKIELCCGGSYPQDYNFKNIKPIYLIGMSVPPVMTAQIANQIKIQWLDLINLPF